MTNNEKELLRMIHKHSNPERAIEIAINTILEFLTRDESSQGQPAVCSQVSA